MGRARWMVDALDLTATPGEASKFLTVGQLSDATGLAEDTIKDSITRSPITVANNPRSAICRPAARIASLPLWSKQQLDEFLTIRQENEDAKDVIKRLEAISEDQARERNLFSLVKFAELLKLHDQTLRRAQSQDGSFPQAVARLSKDVPGVPEHLFEFSAMIEWARAKGYNTPEVIIR